MFSLCLFGVEVGVCCLGFGLFKGFAFFVNLARCALPVQQFALLVPLFKAIFAITVKIGIRAGKLIKRRKGIGTGRVLCV
ncbi:MAG: hypothetical protein HC893_00330 [Chloroflexaceae bacterium]|nr:hypothetical protein [Chloroflexaceae bacterium]